MRIFVHVPSTSAELDAVRTLMRSFIAWHKDRHQDDMHLIDAYFDATKFEAELANLPGDYTPPHGQLLMATIDDMPAGCVALRGIGASSCEMKRMFVYTAYHGLGVGKALGKAIIAEGRALGYQTMRLDTSVRQREAQALYSRLGFKTTPPYYELPDDLRDWLVFMERDLSASSERNADGAS
jgi:GNAT superfamily N-acetyltransferase